MGLKRLIQYAAMGVKRLIQAKVELIESTLAATIVSV
jgi:hypothetical protein